MSRKTLRLGTRRSDLALWQASHVREKLLALYPQLEVELVKIDTRGDKVLNQPIPEVGGKGLFTEEIDQKLRRGEIDLAVHSLKDLPVELPKGLALAAVCDRRWVHDVLIAPNNFTLATLPSGSRVGTCSLRRTAQVKAFRRDLEILPLRGNVPTRLRKLQNGDYDAIILAEAGVRRLGLDAHIREVIAAEIILPAPAQGALGIEIRADDIELQNMLARLNDKIAAAETACERSLLQALGAGCQVPVAALARVKDGELRCDALVGSVDGENVVRDSINGPAAEAVTLGKKLAQALWRKGADKVLKTSTLPLTGRTIVVTRPQDRADEMIATIVQLDGEALVCPMVEVRPLPCADEHRRMLSKLNQFDWLIFTSASAVEALQFRLEKAGASALPPSLRVIAVGEKTAAAVQQRGWRVEAMAEHASAEGVVTTLIEHGAGHETAILFPRALEGRETIPQELEKIGAKIVVLPVYRTAPVIPNNLEDLRSRLRRGKIDAITFTSPSAVNQCFRLFRVEEWPILREICLAAIGVTTATAIREQNLQVQVIPKTASAVALIEAIAEYFNS